MTRFALVLALSGAGAGWIFAQDAAKADLPKAETILDHYIEVTGGKAAYQKRTSEIQTGTFEVPAAGLKGSVTIYSAPPDKSFTSVDLGGIGKMESGTIDGMAWQNNAMTGAQVKSGQEKAESLREANFYATLNWRDLYPSVETKGLETVDGEECYKVEETPKDGKPVTLFFQKKSGLVVKRETVAVSQQMGEVPVEVMVSDYKDFGGILTPTKITQKAMGQEFTITVDSIKVNEAIPPEKFDPPAEVKALLKK
jgi:zinc protease